MLHSPTSLVAEPELQTNVLPQSSTTRRVVSIEALQRKLGRANTPSKLTDWRGLILLKGNKYLAVFIAKRLLEHAQFL